MLLKDRLPPNNQACHEDSNTTKEAGWQSKDMVDEALIVTSSKLAQFSALHDDDVLLLIPLLVRSTPRLEFSDAAAPLLSSAFSKKSRNEELVVGPVAVATESSTFSSMMLNLVVHSPVEGFLFHNCRKDWWFVAGDNKKG